MQFITKAAALTGSKTSCAVIGLFEQDKLPAVLADTDVALAHKRGDFVAKRGKVLMTASHTKGIERFIVVGLGKREDMADKHFMSVAAATVEAVLATTAKDAVLDFTAVTQVSARVQARSIAIAVAEKLYKFDATKSKKDTTKVDLANVTLLVDKAQVKQGQEGFAHGKAMGEGVTLARHLGNLPPNICTPTFLGNTAKDLAKQFKLKVTVHDRAKAEQLKMGSFISVAKGSDEPLKFIELHYNGGTPKQAPVVLVGKAITFDTGGISLKPGANMDEMKFDMCGGASVLGTFRAVAELGLKINLVGLIPACENMPSGRANKPGDVVTSMSGQTVEILNTDAEGRLILNDALTYAERFKPAAVIDIATLTGAMVIALGGVNSGLFSSDDKLADELVAAGRDTNDRAWRMPLEEEYQDQLKSNFADMANIGGPPGGSITAACFLHRYAKAYPWAHLDIAGTAWKQGAAKGATGRPVSLLTQFLINRAG